MMRCPAEAKMQGHGHLLRLAFERVYGGNPEIATIGGFKSILN